MEKYVKKIEDKWLSKIKIMTYRVEKPYRSPLELIDGVLVGGDIENETKSMI